LTVLRFKNTGRRGIRRPEILEPLSITVTGASRVVDATVTAVSAAYVHELGQQEVTRTGEKGHFADVCALEPDTFNPGDWVEVQLIVDGEHGDIKAAGTVYEADREMRDYQQIAASRSTEYLILINFVVSLSFLVVFVLYFGYPVIHFGIIIAIIIGSLSFLWSLNDLDEGKRQKSEQTTHKW
jgi:hypothetical protein